MCTKVHPPAKKRFVVFFHRGAGFALCGAMGIKGLLDLVAPVTTNVHISEYEDKVVAVGT